MRTVHLVIPDLFLPKDFAAEVRSGMSVPALEKLLARGMNETLVPMPLENLVCELFGIPHSAEAPIAPVSAAFDGLASGCWMRADPVNLDLQRDRMLLTGVQVSSEEGSKMCTSLNEHFAGQGLEFFAPNPQRWYVRVKKLPRIVTTPLSQVIGGDIRKSLPTGEDSSHWHQLFNEIQMLLHAHPLNDIREARGEPIINSVWFWGGGCDTLLAKPADCGNSHQAASVVSEEGRAASPGGGYGQHTKLQKNFDTVSSDDVLVEMFAGAASIPFAALPVHWSGDNVEGTQLLVWNGLRPALQRNGLPGWRDALHQFERSIAQPLFLALRAGKIAGLQIDIPGSDRPVRVRLTRGDAWAFWRRSRRLTEYFLV